MRNAILIACLFVTTYAFSQETKYEIYALKYAAVGGQFPVSALVMDGPDNEYLNAAFMIWLIKGSNGKNILVDAGFYADVDEAKDFHVKEFVRPDSVLLKMNVKPQDITDIIITHPHWDHIDGIDLFPNAQIWMQKDDFAYFVGGAWQPGASHGGFNPRDITKIIKANVSGKLTLVDGDDKEIIPGIRVYTGSRHTFNSQYAVVRSGADRVVIASDNLYTYYNLDHLKSAPAGATFDPVGYVNAIKRMKTLASDVKYVIPGHDAIVFTKFPSQSSGVAKIK